MCLYFNHKLMEHVGSEQVPSSRDGICLGAGGQCLVWIEDSFGV